jgi:hypothetical protein
MTAGVRPATEADLPAIVTLYGRAYPHRDTIPPATRTVYMRRMLLEHPWQDLRLPSLVYADRSGKVMGFLGVTPRPMLFRGRPVRMAVSHHFMVDPEARTTLAGVNLIKAYLAGGQDLSICEPASLVVRRIWESVGGTTALFQSLHWTRPLRPFTYGALAVIERNGWGGIGRALAPACRLLDVAASGLGQNPFRPPAGPSVGHELTPEALLEHIEEFSRRFALRPVYDLDALRWLLDILAAKRMRGELQLQRVQGEGGTILGYYLYYTNPGGVSELIQLAARPGAAGEVMERLARDAWSGGSLALHGRLDPRYADEVPRQVAYFSYGGNWFLTHARDAEIRHALAIGDAFLTRLEGEWWIPFHETPRLSTTPADRAARDGLP